MEIKMNTPIKRFTIILALAFVLLNVTGSHAFLGGKFKTLKPKDGKLYIPVKKINDGKAHYYKAKADDGIMVKFFVIQSRDGVIRAAVDACDVCYRAGKGYIQDGNVMVCENCGMRFATERINVVKGGCNPAPLNRVVEGKNLVIAMADINANSWYCKYK